MDGLALTGFDLLVISIVVASAFLALARGATREVLSLASWVGAVILAFHLFARVQPIAQAYVAPPIVADVLAGLGAFLVPLIVFRLVTGVVANRIATSSLGSVDRLLGLALGAARGALVVAAAYLVVSWAMPPPEQPGWVTEARLFPQVREAAVLLERTLPERVRLDGPSAAVRARAAGEAARELGYGDASRDALEQILPGDS